MKDTKAKLLEILSTRPEMVNRFPEWMLSRANLEAMRATPGLAVAEIAGRDSIAAVLRALDSEEVKAILPTIAYTGTEYGDWETLLQKVSRLHALLTDRGVRVYDPVFLGAPALWNELCSRFTAHLVREFGSYSPCLGCHLYLHAIRIPVARMVNSSVIIAGERESHDGRIKINQLAPALDAYRELTSSFGIRLMLPLRYVKSGEEVAAFAGPEFRAEEEQMACVLSRNYVLPGGVIEYSESDIQRFYNEFALPRARLALSRYLPDEAQA